MKKLKVFTLLIGLILLSGCSLPFQSSDYPAWKTNGLIESTDGSKGYMGLYVGDTAKTSEFNITLKEAKTEDNQLIVTLKIENTTNKKQALSNRDFPLMWNLDKETSSYTYPIEEEEKNTLYTFNINEAKDITIKYELKSNIVKPYAIYYGEVYDDNSNGNSYYFYIK